MKRLIDADELINDLSLLLEETQTKTGCSFCDDVSYGEVLSCIEGQDIEYPFTEQDVREAFNSGYSCGMENKDGWIPVVRCIDCKYAEIRKLFGLDIPICKVENNIEQAKQPSHYCGYGEKRDEGKN